MVDGLLCARINQESLKERERNCATGKLCRPLAECVKSIVDKKVALRKNARLLLRNLSEETKISESIKVQDAFLNSKIFNSSRSIGIYLNTLFEVATEIVIDKALSYGYKVFVPEIDKNGNNMKFVRLYTMNELLQPSKNKFGIRELIQNTEEAREIAFRSESLDVIVLPALLYDSKNSRLGHGKGYYDIYLSTVFHHCAKNNWKRPRLVGFAFLEQFSDTYLPLESHDVPVDDIYYPDKISSS